MKLISLVLFGLISASIWGQATITIEVSWAQWSSENRVTFRDSSNNQIGNRLCNPAACFVGGSNAAYNNIGSPETYLSVPFGTNYDLYLEDQYGDGWNGTSYVRVYQDGVLILTTSLTSGSSGTASFNIIAPVPIIAINDISVAEDSGNAIFTVTHNGGSTSTPFTANYTTVDGSAAAGSDYTANSGTISFNGTPGDTEQIIVALTSDSTLEPDETFTIQFTGVSDGSVDISDVATGTIVNDDNNPNTTRPYEERFSMNLKGDFQMRGKYQFKMYFGLSKHTNK